MTETLAALLEEDTIAVLVDELERLLENPTRRRPWVDPRLDDVELALKQVKARELGNPPIYPVQPAHWCE